MNKRKLTYKTSINSLATTYKKYNEELKNKKVLDYGCGKYTDNILTYCKEHNINIDLYDINNPNYNTINKYSYDIVICNNVLNVIEDDAIIKSIIEDILKLTNKAIFKIYQGDRTNKGKTTKIKTYQRNEKTKEYARFFKNDNKIEIKGDFIIFIA